MELWTSDGTEAGTAQVKDIRPGAADALPGSFVAVGPTVYFLANDGTTGRELWKTDGTPEGTVLVSDTNPGAAGGVAGSLTAFNGRLFFLANDGTSGRELWSSGGTPETTAIVREVNPNPLHTAPVQNGFAVVNGRLYFSADDGTHGYELWSTDATAAGTRMEQDLSPGFTSGTLGGLKEGPGGTVYFEGDDGVTGMEPYKFVAPAPPAAVVGRHVFYNNSSFDGNSAAPNAADDDAIASDKAALLPGQAASFANLTAYARGINGVMIDVAGGLAAAALAQIADGVGLKTHSGASGAAWVDAPRPSEVGVRAGAGVNGSDRITLTWPDGAIRNAWLRVTVSAPQELGLPQDVFTFGNVAGDTGDLSATFRVNALDLAAVKRALNTASDVTGRFDFNRDGRVNALDLAAVKQNLGRALATPANLFAENLPLRLPDER